MTINYNSPILGDMPFLKAGKITYLFSDKETKETTWDSLTDNEINLPTSFISLLSYALLAKGEYNGFSFTENAKVLYVSENSCLKEFDYLINLYIGNTEISDNAKERIFAYNCNFSKLKLNELFEYAKSNNVNYIFIDDPFAELFSSIDTRAISNLLQDLACKYNIGVLYSVIDYEQGIRIYKGLDVEYKGLDVEYKGLDVEYKGLDVEYKGLDVEYKGIYHYNVKQVGNKKLFTIESLQDKHKIPFRLLENGLLCCFKAGYKPNKSTLIDIFKKLLTTRKWNYDNCEYETVDMPKFQNDLVRIMFTTQVNDCIQSERGAQMLINYAEAEGIIERTRDKALIASCNTLQMIKNHKSARLNFAYKFIGE